MDENFSMNTLNQALEKIVTSSHDGYKEVLVLLVSWEDTDDSEISKEIEGVNKLFSDRFGFRVKDYHIPSTNPEQSLEREVWKFAHQFEKPEESLMILYYAGHGGKDSEDSRAEWAARLTGGPVLKWSKVQQYVLDFEGDVLLILDCCCAALAARARTSHIYELLGASGPDKYTPPAGPYSFTSSFLQVVNEMLDQNLKTTVEAIYERLEQQEKLTPTPIRSHLLGGEKTIELRPVQKRRSSGAEITVDGEPLTSLSIVISMSKKFDDSNWQRFQQWVKTDLPDDVSEIHVKSISKVNQFRRLLHDDPSLQEAISNDLRSGNQAEVITPPRIPVDGNGSFGSHVTKSTIARLVLKRFHELSELIHRSMKTNLILNPSFHSTDRMQELRENSCAKQLGLSDAAKLRLLSTGIDEEDPKKSFLLGPNHVKHGDKERKHNYPHVGNHMVYIEYHKYDQLHSSKSKVSHNVEKLSRFLALMPKAISTLQYEGYVDNPHKHQFELVFRTPVKYPTQKPPFISLEEAYTKVKSIPFDERCLIAVALVKCLHSLHDVGCCHGNLRPKNVIFLLKDNHIGHDPFDHSDYDLSRPLVLGLDISHAEDKITGRHEIFYMHPDKWKKPHEKFSPIHDIYSLGVLLLEIGCWHMASEFDRIRINYEKPEDKRKVSKRLIEAAQAHLLEKTGSRKYLAAVVACLDGTFDEDAKDTGDPSRLQKAFASQVLVILETITSGLW